MQVSCDLEARIGQLLSQIGSPRLKLLEATGYDIYNSAKFLEHLGLQILEAAPAKWDDYFDGRLPSGETVEIKCSGLAVKSRGTSSETHVFQFRRLRGMTNRQKSDLYLLIGNDGGGILYMWRIPGRVLRGRLKKYGEMAFVHPPEKKQQTWYNEYLIFPT